MRTFSLVRWISVKYEINIIISANRLLRAGDV